MKKPIEFIKSVEDLLELIEKRDLVRNTNNDHNFAKFAEQGFRIIKVLSDVRNNLDKIKKKKNNG